ncbi:transmembrane and coiled-coil domain-containing protein 3 [Pyxicephalus adspersus]|uniref:transmembrane and coiled-coil domain-containing protein 3 n=1 Tax=Pyxicephalus adspersus TaxID=30357 RepID=UPI003B5B0F66
MKIYILLVLPLQLCYHTIHAAEHEGVAKHAIKLHRGKGATASQKKEWLLNNCRKLSGLLHQKTVVLNKLKNAIKAVEKDPGLSPEEKLFQVHTFEIFQKELNESENSVFQAVHGLRRALQGDYKDVVNMKESSRQRLEALREAAIKVCNGVRGVNVEAVLRVEEDEVKRNTSQHQAEDDLGLSMLIDSQNNQYILTKPRDSTIPRADHHFIKDIVTIVMLSLPCGWLCTTIGLPTMFGYIMCGVLLGPSGLNSIKSIVQVETLGEFGVFYTLFLVGLEFSPERLRKVWKIAVQGPCFMTVLMIAFGLLWGHFLQIRPTQSVFISTCLSLSSTPLVSRFLAGGSRGDKDGDIDYSSVLLGMLVMQDVQLSLFIAAMPTLIQAGGNTYSSVLLEAFRILALIGQIIFSLLAVFLVCLIIKTYLIGPYYRRLHTESKGNKEILVMGISAFIFLMLTITELLDVSMELGCFLAGALISSQGHMVTEEVMSSIEPIRDFLAIIFFASIGLHVFPTFVIYELTILLSLTLTLVLMKFVLAVLVLSLILPKSSQYIKWIVSSGLAQVSEFSFVLGSRARRSGIISREVYLLILSVTTLSLLLAPALWRIAITKCVPRPDKRLST